MQARGDDIPILYIFSGLPGTGKSSLAKDLAARTAAVYLRIDTVEQALRDLCAVNVEGEGYRLSYRIAADNLRVGLSVVADSCNLIDLTRDEWEQVAADAGAHHIIIEVVCSDQAEHRKRVESRAEEVSRLTLPGWEQVKNREYEPWSRERVVIDTSRRTLSESIDELKSLLE